MLENRKSIIINTIPLLAKLTGVGKYIFEVTTNLKKFDEFDYSYFYGYVSKELIRQSNDRSNSKFDIISDLLLKSSILRAIIRKMIFSFSNFISKEFAIYWEPNHILLPKIKAKIRITTIHDLSIIRHPEFHPLERVSYFNKNIVNTIKNSDHFITVSNFIKKDICDYFCINPEKITVIYNGFCGEIFKKYPYDTLVSFKNSFNLPENFILYVGTIEPRKNLKNLLIAYNEMSKEFKRHVKLVLAGYQGWENTDIFNLMNKDKENIIYLGYLEDLQLAYLYNLAKVLVYPSIYEGFGLPPLEALACGTPVITSNVSSMPEIYGDAAYYVNPYDPNEMRLAIERVIEDSELRGNLLKNGEKITKNFSWERSAKEHFELFKKCMS